MITEREHDDAIEAQTAIEVLQDLKGWEEVCTIKGEFEYKRVIWWLKRIVDRVEQA